MRIDWAPAVLRGAGLTVVELDGCYGRGAPLQRVDAIVNHGFGVEYGGGWTDTAFDRMLAGGRPDLAGPLSQFGLDDEGTWVFVADGKANHNGHGRFGNKAIGVEAYGKKLFTPQQCISWKVGNAALLNYLGLAADRCFAHKETDPGRKPDPIGIDMGAFRADVGLYQHELRQHGALEDLTIMDAATKAYLDERFAAIDGRLTTVEKNTGVLRNALKGTNSTGGKSALWLKLEAGFGAVIDAVKAEKG